VDVAALVRREEVEVAGQTYTLDRTTLTLEGWAKTPAVAALGLSAQAIRSRLEHGWMLEDALTTPKGDPRPETSAPKRSTAAQQPRKKAMVPQRPRKAPPAAVARVAEAIEERAAVPAPTRRRIGDAPRLEQVHAPALQLTDLLTRLGYVVEDAGVVPAGWLLLVRGAA
jgi:hypothetical protein